MTVRVLLVDDERMVCAHLRTILGAAADLDVVGEAYDGADAVEQVIGSRPDVVLLDLRMPGVDGLTALDRLVALEAPPRVVVLTTFDVDSYVLRALEAGAVGFLLKSTAPEDLVGLVRAAAAGHTVLSPPATRRLVGAAGEHASGHRRARDLIGQLSERETEVLAGIGAGESNAGIGRRLHLSEATVKGYVSAVMAKLGCRNRTQAALVAYAGGLVGLDP